MPVCKVFTSAVAPGPDNSCVTPFGGAITASFDHPMKGIDVSDEATEDTTKEVPAYNRHSDEIESYTIRRDFPSKSYRGRPSWNEV